MTAPDPRVGEIEARYRDLATPQQAHLLSPKINGASMEMWMIEDSEEREIGYVHSEDDASRILNAPDDLAYLLAELRKAHEALAEAWEQGRDAEFQRSVMKRQADPNPYRAAVAAAKGDGE